MDAPAVVLVIEDQGLGHLIFLLRPGHIRILGLMGIVVVRPPLLKPSDCYAIKDHRHIVSPL